MLLAIAAVIIGLALLIWSADRFVDGAAATASYFGMPPMLIGMIVIGFGTSAPEMLVSAVAAYQGNPALALGNAIGSNIANIGLILGLTAILSPILVQKSVVRRELPLLLGVTLVFSLLLLDGSITQIDAFIMIGVFALAMGYSIWASYRDASQSAAEEAADASAGLSRMAGLVWLVVGLLLLIVSSRMLVYGAVNLAGYFGVSDVIIGLTVLAVGTSLPELAASLAAVRKGEHEMALGNVVGSNLFNTLLVVGIAGLIQPMQVASDIILRDLPAMAGITLTLWLMCIAWGRTSGKQAYIGRLKGVTLLSIWVVYTCLLIYIAFLE